MLPFVDRFEPVLAHYGIELLVAEVEERLEEEEIIAYGGQFDGSICGDDRFTAKAIDACLPRLKVISKWGTGIDSIDKAYANEKGVMVGNTPNAFTLPVADSVMGYILSFARRQPAMDRAMKAGKWEKIAGRSLAECTLGVIGVGNIGKAVIRRARGFGMEILGNDIIEISQDFVDEMEVEMTSLEDLLSRADFVSINCSLNPTSEHLINAERLAQMKQSAYLINTARGPVVNEKDLVAALQQGKIAGAGLDVFEFEPLPKDSPLLGMDNVILAPHNSNSSPMAWERVHWNTVKNLLIGLEIPAENFDRTLFE
jgi:D-3-phosphoglycerate dehydrogenase